MSWNSQHTEQVERDMELLDSVIGSAQACANVSIESNMVRQTKAGCLTGPLTRLAVDFSLMSQSYTTAEVLLKNPKSFRGKDVSPTIRLTQERCQQIATELPIILRKHGEWDIVDVHGSCRRLNMLSKTLRVLKSSQDLLLQILDLVPILARRPARGGPFDTSFPSQSCASALDQAQKAICLLKKELLDYQVTKASVQATNSEELPVMDDWSTTQSTTGIMTPTADWSDLGSDTTEVFHRPAITRHSLQLCGYATANFLRLISEIHNSFSPYQTLIVDTETLERLHKAFDESIVHLLHTLDAPVPSQSHLSQISNVGSVTNQTLYQCVEETERFLDTNNLIEESFGHLPGSTSVGTAAIEAMHRAYSNLVDTLLSNLAAPIPFQNDRFAPTSAPAPVPTPVSAPAPEVPRTVVLEV
jgi:hypothetical protein